jgi:hypothetical protein
MIFFLFISYFFLVMSQSIQARFSMIYDSPENAPKYFSTPLKLIIPISAFIVTYYHFKLIFPYELSVYWLIPIHFASAVVLSSVFQVIYIKRHGFSKQSPEHVWFSILFGYLFLSIYYFFG